MDNSFWSIILRNWKVVLLSFLGATTFWFFNALGKNYNARINYPLKFSFDEDSVVVVDPLPKNVLIDVSSGGWNLLSQTFSFSAKPIIIDMDNPTDIRYLTRSTLLPIVSDQLNRLNVNYVFTDTLKINIQEKWSIKVAVKVDSLLIDMSDNYRITSPIRTDVDSVVITGPSSLISEIKSPYFIPVNERNIDDTFSELIDVPLSKEKIMTAEPADVRIMFSVERFDLETIMVPIEAANFPEDSSQFLAIGEIEVSYLIQRSGKVEFSAEAFMVTADLQMLDELDSTVEAILIYQPENAIDVELNPLRIKIIYAQK